MGLDGAIKKAKPPAARFFISLPLADNERLSEDFVGENLCSFGW